MLMDNSLCRVLSAWAPQEGRGGGVRPETHQGPWHSPRWLPLPLSFNPGPRWEVRISSEKLSSGCPESSTPSDLTLVKPLTLKPTCLRSLAPTPGQLWRPSAEGSARNSGPQAQLLPSPHESGSVGLMVVMWGSRCLYEMPLGH